MLKKSGKALGFVCAYLVFTTVLFTLLILLEKLPYTWSYYHVMGITLAITLAGSTLKRWLQ